MKRLSRIKVSYTFGHLKKYPSLSSETFQNSMRVLFFWKSDIRCNTIIVSGMTKSACLLHVLNISSHHTKSVCQTLKMKINDIGNY